MLFVIFSSLHVGNVCDWKTRVWDMVLSPYTCWNILSVFDVVFPKHNVKFEVYSFIQYSELNDLEKSRSNQKYVEKNEMDPEI